MDKNLNQNSQRQRQRRWGLLEASRSCHNPVQSKHTFNFYSSMDQNLQNLRRIGKNLEFIKKDFHEEVVKPKDHMDNNSKASSISLTSLKASQQPSMREVEVAEEVCEDLLDTLLHIKLTYQLEESDLVSRASCLEKEIESFEKMSPDALAKIRKATRETN
jgi:hypothetical protein